MSRDRQRLANYLGAICSECLRHGRFPKHLNGLALLRN